MDKIGELSFWEGISDQSVRNRERIMANWITRKPTELSGNVFDEIGTRWLLLTAWDETNQRVNAMTASWGGMGILWNRPVLFAFVRPQRYTYELFENTDLCSACVLEAGRKEAYRICGTKSGRDTDKISESGLTAVNLDGIWGFEEAERVYKLRKLFVADMSNATLSIESGVGYNGLNAVVLKRDAGTYTYSVTNKLNGLVISSEWIQAAKAKGCTCFVLRYYNANGGLTAYKVKDNDTGVGKTGTNNNYLFTVSNAATNWGFIGISIENFQPGERIVISFFKKEKKDISGKSDKI